jgi:DNA processing protein
MGIIANFRLSDPSRADSVCSGAMNLQSASYSRGRSFNAAEDDGYRMTYRPPGNWRKVTIADLLSGSPREQVVKEQFEFWSIGPKSKAAVETVFVAGDADLLKRRCIAVIGSREVSEEGRKRATRIARELVEQDIVVVSGLAAGVDCNAMRSAISNGGRTIGVIGTPLDKAYPASNAPLQEEVYRDHLLVSQFASGERTYRSSFPERNKTMALLSDASVVIEASDTSGTLHQASECVRQNRWLGILKSVVDDPRLSWPKDFLNYERCLVIDSTETLVASIYPK